MCIKISVSILFVPLSSTQMILYWHYPKKYMKVANLDSLQDGQTKNYLYSF